MPVWTMREQFCHIFMMVSVVDRSAHSFNMYRNQAIIPKTPQDVELSSLQLVPQHTEQRLYCDNNHYSRAAFHSPMVSRSDLVTTELLRGALVGGVRQRASVNEETRLLSR